mmetsp:Transcript_20945/g.66081  ORF Transcript_20945/g.66081 Transcript_20945/m.66081 type:complete len:213 (-) Transcript_20945:96-734(-)
MLLLEGVELAIQQIRDVLIVGAHHRILLCGEASEKLLHEGRAPVQELLAVRAEAGRADLLREAADLLDRVALHGRGAFEELADALAVLEERAQGRVHVLLNPLPKLLILSSGTNSTCLLKHVGEPLAQLVPADRVRELGVCPHPCLELGLQGREAGERHVAELLAEPLRLWPHLGREVLILSQVGGHGSPRLICCRGRSRLTEGNEASGKLP